MFIFPEVLDLEPEILKRLSDFKELPERLPVAPCPLPPTLGLTRLCSEGFSYIDVLCGRSLCIVVLTGALWGERRSFWLDLIEM